MSVFSHRAIWERGSSDFAARLERVRASGRHLLDLSESNPARCGLTWDPAELGSLLGDRRAAHEPDGSREARAAVARYLADRGAATGPERVFLAPSTSEACGLLFNILCDPGDEVLVPLPSHPLLDRVAELESVLLTRYALRYDGEWRLDRGSLTAAVSRRTRAVVVSSPSSPTGALLSSEELTFLADLCSTRGLALIGDEAFADTALGPAATVAGTTHCLSCHLSGLAGVCGLPQLRVAWMAIAGPEPLVQPAISRLETLADPYLSISRPAELALPALLERRGRFLGALRSRLAQNRAYLATASLREAPWSVLQSGGGWWAVLEIGASENEQALCVALLEHDGVIVEPGLLCDFERSGYLVVSLLPDPDVFRQGIQRLEARLRGPLSG